MVTFTYPWALVAALPAAWLLWRARRRSVTSHTVANLFLWLDAPKDNEQRLHRSTSPPWIVWLQAAVLIAFAVAAAGPELPAVGANAVRIIDASMSMSAREGGTTRLELARTAARAWQADGASVDEISVTGGPADLAAAIEAARQRTSGEIFVASDLPAPPQAAALGVTWRQVGAPASNVAITALEDTPDGSAIVEVQNFGEKSQTVSLTVLGGASPWRKDFEIDADGVEAFVLPSISNGTLTAEISVDDETGNALTADDRRIALIERRRLKVLVASNDSRLRAAAGVLPNVDANVIPEGAAAPPGDVNVISGGAPAPTGIPSLIFVPGGSTPVVTRRESNGIRTVTVSVDLPTSAWPLTPAFPLLVADSIDWLARRRSPSLTAARVETVGESNTRNAAPPRVAEVALASIPSRVLWNVVAVAALLGLAIEVALRRRRPAARAAAAAVAAAAIIGIPLPFGQASRTAIVALDSSASVAGNQRAAGERIRRETEAAEGSDTVEVARFGGTETDIAAGLRAARAALPESGDRRILLITDGQQTSGDAAAEARAAGAAGVPIDVIPVDSRAPAYVERVDAPVVSRAGAPLIARVFLKGRPSELLRLTMWRGEQQLVSRRVVLDEAGGAITDLTDRPIESGVIFYRAVLSTEPSGITLSENSAAVSVTGRGRLLVLSDRPGTFRRRVAALPMEIVDSAPASAPSTRAGFAAFSAIAIDAVAPHRFSARQLEAITDAVSIDGAGLLVLGTEESLDPSEFASGGFAEALPIDFTALPRPPATSASLALLVDISGSMASTVDGVVKIAAARDAIARALAVVPSADVVAVIGFAAQPVLLIAPADGRDAAAIAEKLKGVTPTGSTSIAPAVREGVAWLKGQTSERRRILLVTDGKTSIADAEAARAAVRNQGIEVSVVTIGSDAERQWLAELASATGGRAVFPNRLTDLSREVAREAARGQRRLVNEPFTVRGGAHALAPGDPAPGLNGYVAGRLRDGATAAWKSHTGDAVLAAWSRGLGRVAVFASDAEGPWGTPLRTWGPAGAFWIRAVEWVARSSDPAPVDAELLYSADGPRIAVEVRNSVLREGALPSVRAIIAGPSGQSVTTDLHAVTVSRFEGPVTLSEPGDYRATLTVSDRSAGTEARVSRGWHWAGERESQARGMNLTLLEEIARASGGGLQPALGSPADPGSVLFAGPRSRGRVPALPWLLLAALALLSADYVRRAVES